MLQNISSGWKLVIAILVCQGAGVLGSIFTNSSRDSWYQTLEKPAFNPPGWVFGPVWITLYLMMGIALFLVWKKTPFNKTESRAVTWFFVQLVLNVLWSFCFFYLRSPALASIEILLLLFAIAATASYFWRISRTAGVLLLPYIAWTSFATLLTFTIWRLNS